MADLKMPTRRVSPSVPKKAKRSDAKARGIVEPIGVYVATPRGLVLPPGTSDAAKWRDLKDVGRRLACPPMPTESLREYARRLWVRLEPLKRDESLNGAAVTMLRHIVNMYLRAR